MHRPPIFCVLRARSGGVTSKLPLMPFGIVLVIAVMGVIVSLVGAVPWLGEIAFGLLFVVFLLVGFVLMLLVLGMMGGMRLFYPAIAVEGSDNFDAMSRSFSYLYARPWRVIFYTVVSLVYGTFCFLFVALAVFLLLALTHWFAGYGVGLFGYVHGWYSGIDKLETLWPTPRFGRMWTPVNWWAMSWTEYLGSGILHLWMFLLMCSVAAFVVSLYYSSNTILYFLLRRSVDGQSLMEIYEEDDKVASQASTPMTESPAQLSSSTSPASDPSV